MDNTGKNLIIRKKFKEKFQIKVEFTPPDIPELNSIVERGFAIRWENKKN